MPRTERPGFCLLVDAEVDVDRDDVAVVEDDWYYSNGSR